MNDTFLAKLQKIDLAAMPVDQAISTAIELMETFNFIKKRPSLRVSMMQCRTSIEVQAFAWNTALSGIGHKVVSLRRY